MPEAAEPWRGRPGGTRQVGEEPRGVGRGCLRVRAQHGNNCGVEAGVGGAEINSTETITCCCPPNTDAKQRNSWPTPSPAAQAPVIQLLPRAPAQSGALCPPLPQPPPPGPGSGPTPDTHTPVNGNTVRLLPGVLRLPGGCTRHPARLVPGGERLSSLLDNRTRERRVPALSTVLFDFTPFLSFLLIHFSIVLQLVFQAVSLFLYPPQTSCPSPSRRLFFLSLFTHFFFCLFPNSTLWTSRLSLNFLFLLPAIHLKCFSRPWNWAASA